MDTKILAGEAIGAGLGALQTPLLREQVDRKYPTMNIPQLKGFGTPSALVGMIAGGGATAVAVIGTTKGKDGRQRIKDEIVHPLAAYGVVSLITGILSGVFPAVTQADCVAKGGYWYDNACHKAPQTGTVSMETPPAVTRSFIPPASVQSMDTLKLMTAEVQRLSQENAQLKVMLEPGTVASKQAQYGFMNPNTGVMFVPGQPTKPAREFGFMQPGGEGIAPQHMYNPGAPLTPENMYVPGQPTRPARRFGFMDGGSTPVAQVQMVKSKYDFMG